MPLVRQPTVPAKPHLIRWWASGLLLVRRSSTCSPGVGHWGCWFEGRRLVRREWGIGHRSVVAWGVVVHVCRTRPQGTWFNSPQHQDVATHRHHDSAFWRCHDKCCRAPQCRLGLGWSAIRFRTLGRSLDGASPRHGARWGSDDWKRTRNPTSRRLGSHQVKAIRASLGGIFATHRRLKPLP